MITCFVHLLYTHWKYLIPCEQSAFVRLETDQRMLLCFCNLHCCLLSVVPAKLTAPACRSESRRKEQRMILNSSGFFNVCVKMDSGSPQDRRQISIDMEQFNLGLGIFQTCVV